MVAEVVRLPGEPQTPSVAIMMPGDTSILPSSHASGGVHPPGNDATAAPTPQSRPLYAAPSTWTSGQGGPLDSKEQHSAAGIRGCWRAQVGCGAAQGSRHPGSHHRRGRAMAEECNGRVEGRDSRVAATVHRRCSDVPGAQICGFCCQEVWLRVKQTPSTLADRRAAISGDFELVSWTAVTGRWPMARQ